MPGRTLPTIASIDVASRKTAASCYVTVGTNVYDVTNFLDDHPGGGELILGYGGKDVADIMDNQISHAHSDSAKEMLDEMLVGFVATEPILKTAVQSEQPENILPLPPNRDGVRELQENGATSEFPDDQVCAATGMSSAADLSKETDAVADYRAHKFLDLDKPLLMQVWHGGFSKDFYLEQVHRPRHYKSGASAPLFGNFLEPLSKTAWYVIPMVWLPPVAYGTYLAYQGLPSVLQLVLYWLTGLGLWTLIEYGLHRGLFHVDKYLPDNRVGITTHFLLHGIHHYLPMDKLRLVMPPALFVALATPFYKLAHTVFYWDWYVATAVFCGGIFGYICYDLTHYFLHHKTLPSFYNDLKKYHMQHHYKDFENGFGVTSRFWDRVFGTELAPPRPHKVD
ncbi:fatty acid alpha-hydroxylase [Pseudocyphellaria aurata]|nr:fatty acid alpha-hydroxylase [Pseudocyphellaria aurata]